MKGLIHNLFLLGCVLYMPTIVAALAGWKTVRNVWLLAISCGLLILIKSDSNENYAYHLEPFMPVNLQPIMGLQ